MKRRDFISFVPLAAIHAALASPKIFDMAIWRPRLITIYAAQLKFKHNAEVLEWYWDVKDVRDPILAGYGAPGSGEWESYFKHVGIVESQYKYPAGKLEWHDVINPS